MTADINSTESAIVEATTSARQVFLLREGAVAALGQALIPYYTGLIIDYASIDQRFEDFQRTCLLLVGVAFGTAVFTGESAWYPIIVAHAYCRFYLNAQVST